jgi:hypothetical protein
MKICKGMGIAWVVVMLAATAGAETVLVDFGNSSSYRGASVSNPDQNGRHWNSVHSGAFYANMVDTANAATTIDLGFDTGGASDSYNGPAGATTQPPTPAELAATAFDAAALGALGATNAVFDYYVNSRFQLQGLDANRTYRLTFFGSHKYSTDNTTTYSLCSDNTYATVLASTNLDVQVPGSTWLHNSNRVAVLAGAAPQAGGVFYVKFLGTNGNNGYLNAMMIELEKATPTLGVSVSRSVEQGTASVTLTGRVSGANGTVVPANGETVGVTINGVTQNATVGGGAGAFSVAYNTASLTAGTYTITYAYAGNATSLNGATNAATALTVLPRYETVLIDMANDSAFRSVSVSNPDSNGRYWNSVHGAAYYADMVNKSNVATRVDLGFDAGSSDSYNGPAGATTQPPTPSELAATAFDAAALGELGVTNAVFDYYVNARFQVQGLETGLSYRLTFYGAHKYSTDDATVYGLCTDSTYATTTATVTLNVQVPGSANLHNSNTVAVMAGASPQADGKFYVSMNGANGHSGYLNAMKVEWEKVTAAISGVSASQTNAYGTSSVTLTGVVGAANVPGRAGEVVGVTINGVTSNATVSGDGAFSVVFPVSGVAAGTHTVTYAYTGSTVLLGATNAATALTVTKVTPVIGVRASQSVEAGTSSVTLTGVVSGAGGIYPANGSTVGVTINGVTQNATVGGGAGAFSVAYTTASLTAGTYTITYAYAGNATSLNGATNAATALTVLPRYETVLIDMANDSAFRSVSVSNPDSNGRYWNSVHGAAYYADMVNKSNVATRVDLGFDAGSSDSYNGPAGATTQPPTPSELAATAFDAAALGELGVTNAVFDYYVNARFQVQGLETGLSYRLTFYGAHKYSTDDATVYGLCTDNTYATTTTTVSLNVQVPGSANLHNSNTVAVMAGASPQADGKFYVSMNGANGHSGYLNAMKVEWEKVTAAISGVSASQTNAYGTASVTLTGVVGAANVPGRAGEVVGVTINGVTSNATVSGDGAFSVVFPVSGVAAGSHTITYAYAGSTVLLGATNAATTLTVTKVTPVIGVRASQGVEAGTASVTLTGVVSGAGGIYPANGSTVGVTINGVTQNATVGGGAGAFSVAYNTASLTAGTYTITYAYTGNATSLNGATNAATALTVLPRYETVLIDLANDSAFRSVSVSNPDSNGRYWNSVHGAAYYADMVNKSNVATRVDLGFDAGSSDSYNGPAGATTQPPTPSELAATAFDAAALGELGVTNAVFDYYVNARFQVQGLETGLSYRLTFYGAHKYSTDDATVYGLCTDNTYATTTTTVSLNVQVPGSANLHNSNTVAVMAGASPQADGKFYVSMNGANGHSGYLNAMKVEWEKVTAAISGVSASQTNAYGTASVTLTGVVGAANVPGRAGEVVGVTINGVTSNATVSGDGAFSVVFPVSGVAAGSHTITYAYAGSTVLLGATNAATTLTVTKVTPVIGVRASQGVEAGTASVTLTGRGERGGGDLPGEREHGGGDDQRGDAERDGGRGRGRRSRWRTTRRA